MTEPRRPLAAVAFSIVGAAFLLVEGALLEWIGSVASSVGLAGLGGFFSSTGELGLWFGFVLLLFSYGVYTSPDHHLSLGIGILVTSLISLYAGGGFILGVVFGAIGGVLAMAFVPDMEPEPVTEAPSPSPEPRCPGCDEVVPRWSSICPFCTTPLPREESEETEGDPAA